MARNKEFITDDVKSARTFGWHAEITVNGKHILTRQSYRDIAKLIGFKIAEYKSVRGNPYAGRCFIVPDVLSEFIAESGITKVTIEVPDGTTFQIKFEY